MICQTCGRKEAEEGRPDCFRCRVSTIGVTFVGGGGYGRTIFKQRTNAEFINEYVPPGAEPVERGCWT
jgi:hypothetical protein